VEGSRPSGKRQRQNWQQPGKATLRSSAGAGGRAERPAGITPCDSHLSAV